ncbi:MAG: site-2 protease family protein [Planctomycetes bacterium]|nr:site-2 protease family protein [Planctomycetota bacterium]
MQLSAREWMLVGTGLFVLLVSEVLHEVIRARVADLCGDPTPREKGRITWRLWRFVDPLGTLIVPGLALAFSHGQLIFGGARPTAIDETRMKWPRLGGMAPHAAGPLANLGVAALSALLLRWLEPTQRSLLGTLLWQGVWLNCLLIVWHLLPFPGTNLGRMVRALLPPRGKHIMDQLEGYVFYLFLFMIFMASQRGGGWARWFYGRIGYFMGSLQDLLLG